MSYFKIGDWVITGSWQGKIVDIHKPSLAGTSVCVNFGGGLWQCFKPEQLQLTGASK